LYPNINFVEGTADALPFENGTFDVYCSLRTWCIAGVVPHEAFVEAVRVLRPNGLLIVSYPLRFDIERKSRTLLSAIEDDIKSIALMSKELFDSHLLQVGSVVGPEEMMIFGRSKN